jgi:hypothetical protein
MVLGFLLTNGFECSTCSGCSTCGRGVWDGVGGWVSTGSPCGVELPCVDGVGAVVSRWSQPGISRLEGRVMTGRLFVCCPGFPLPALDSVLGDLLNAFAGDLQLLHLHEGVEDYLRLTLYWPYC